jgi:hypothetical protein
MKLHETRRQNITTSGELVHADMGLDEAGVAMAISFLRDKIYSNKPLAVIREYWANARDEHDKYNVDQAVRIELPHRDDPVLRIRDYAQGLNQDDVFKIFGQYFKSTKNDENRSIGGFGIGSKSGHAYGDAFTVASHYEGTCSIYEAVLETDEDTGFTVGRMYLLGESPTEESGIEISLTVKESDCIQFQSTCRSLFQYLSYDELPKVILADESFVLDESQINEDMPSGDSWFICHHGRYSYAKNAMVAVIGGVGYEVDSSIFNSDSSFTREMLSLLEKILIRNALRQVQTDIENWIEGEIAGAENVLKAKARLSELVKDFDDIWTKHRTFRYKDQAIKPGLQFFGNFITYRKTGDVLDLGLKAIRHENVHVRFDDRLYYLVSNTNAGGLHRARTICNDGMEDNDRIIVIHFQTEDERDAWIEKNDLKLSFFTDWLTVKKTVPKYGVRGSNGLTVRGQIARKYLHKIHPDEWTYRKIFPRLSIKELPEHAMYVIIDHNNECIDERHESNRWKGRVIDRNHMKGVTALMAKIAPGFLIVGVKKSAPKIPDSWETVEEFFTRRLKNESFRQSVVNIVGTNAEYRALPIDDHENIFQPLLDHHRSILPDALVEWIEEVNMVSKDYKDRLVDHRHYNQRHVEIVAEFELLDNEAMQKAQKLKAEADNLLARYPILKVLDGNTRYWFDLDLIRKQVAEYMAVGFTESSRNNIGVTT